MEKTLIGYVPHGVDSKLFYNIIDSEQLKSVVEMKKNFFGDVDVTFVVLYNNRNIRRKMTGDVVLAYRKFLMGLPKDKAEKCRLLLHTQPVDENGTDLWVLLRDIAPEVKFSFTGAQLAPEQMNVLYNTADVVINLASNEGFGLSTLEGIMAERMIVANVTGGLQDQMGFKDREGNYVNEDVHFNKEWGSNHDGKYQQHGEWVVPVFPNNLSVAGSPPTPYIFDDRCDWREAAEKIREIYDMDKTERQRCGTLGREYCLTQGFTSEEMCRRMIVGIDETLESFTPRKRFDIFKV